MKTKNIMSYIVVIPARYASTRLPGKPLIDILGKTMLERVWLNAKKSQAKEVIIATDDQRIASKASQFGASVCMTSNEHQSGSDRITEVIDQLQWNDEQVVLNLQGDEPLMSHTSMNEWRFLIHHQNPNPKVLYQYHHSLLIPEPCSQLGAGSYVEDNQGK